MMRSGFPELKVKWRHKTLGTRRVIDENHYYVWYRQYYRGMGGQHGYEGRCTQAEWKEYQDKAKRVKDE